MDKVLDAHKDIIVAKVNVNEYDNIADEFNVTSIPHLVFFKKGKLQKDYINTSDHEALIAHLDEIFTGDTMSSASNKDTDSLEENNTEEANDDSGTKDDNKKVDESDTKDNE
jgi:thioredoxin-like negative regulator of GroEL